jgi:hypothetical protein
MSLAAGGSGGTGMLDDVQLDMIVRRFHDGLCVPFLGAAANIRSPVRKYRGLPVGRDLVKELRRTLEHPPGWSADLARATLEYEVRTDREDLLSFLEERLAHGHLEPSLALKVLARLPFPLIITTNFDTLLERALEQRGRDFKCLVQPQEGFLNIREIRDRLESLAEYADANGTIVYKIHGTLGNHGLAHRRWLEVPSNVTVTEDDYIEFLTVQDQETDRIGVPSVIKGLITPRTLLFLGYSLEDWDFRTIYGSLVGPLTRHQRRKSFAVQKNPLPYWVIYWLKRDIQIIDMDVYDFCERLEERYFNKYPDCAGP